MSPRNELLSTRRLGPAGAELLYRTVYAVAVSRGFPPPDGSTIWDRSAVAETAHDFVNDERGAKRLLDVAIRSTDDASFRRLLDVAVLNFLRDIARGTDMGKLILRVKEILRKEREFQLVRGRPERWTLAGGRHDVSQVSASELTAATVGVHVVVPKWTSTKRDAPLADRASFVRLISSVLTAAKGSLTAVDLAHALAGRLDHRRTGYTVDLDIQERVSEPGSMDGDPATRTAAELHALNIFDSLSDRERIILTAIDKNVRDLGMLIGTGKTQAAHLRQLVVDRIRDELAGDEDPELTASIVCKLCEEWIEGRTGWDGTTSSDG